MIAVDEPLTIDTTDPATFLNRAFKYLLANHELLNIRKRTSQGIRNAIASGRVVNNVPFGYKNVRDAQDKPTLEIDESKAGVVRKIFERYLYGVPPAEILKEARASGFAKSGNGVLARVLSNPVYAGLLRLPPGSGEPERFVKALHQPIINEAQFWIANQKLNQQPKYRSVPRSDFPLGGVVKCDCGWHLTASYSKGKCKYYLYYSCPKERNSNYRGERMHELVENVLMELSFTEEQIDRINNFSRHELDEQLKYRKNILVSISTKLTNIATKIERLEEKLINDEIEVVTYKKWL